MAEKIQPSHAHHNHLNLYEKLLPQHERALHCYYQLIDKTIDNVVGTENGDELMNAALLGLLANHYDTDLATAKQLLTETEVPLPLDATLQDEEFHRRGKELLLLFPLLEFGNLIDSTYEPAAAEEWYEQVAAAILMRTDDLHTAACTEHSNHPYPQDCQHSTSCPRRIVANVLTRQAKEPDFNSLEYVLDPERQINTTISKVNAACANDLATADLRDFYETVTNHLFSDQR